jgi:PTH1 family peptidyl-tRNA hydrolase
VNNGAGTFAGLIVGLGNPGPEYANTRHNLGFLFVDALIMAAEREPRPVAALSGGMFRCLLWKTELQDGRMWLAAKPQTFMNASGECVQPLAAWHRLAPDQIVVVHDEMDLPQGRMRFKIGGGNAGHNGLASITQSLGVPDFYRLRLGIGRPPHGGEAINWVLGRFSADEHALHPKILQAALDVLRDFVLSGPKKAIAAANSFNAMPAPRPES